MTTAIFALPAGVEAGGGSAVLVSVNAEGGHMRKFALLGVLLAILLVGIMGVSNAAPVGVIAFSGKAQLNSGFPCTSGCTGGLYGPESRRQSDSIGGEGGIRTHGTLARTTVFETVPIDHSGTSPARRL